MVSYLEFDLKIKYVKMSCNNITVWYLKNPALGQFSKVKERKIMSVDLSLSNYNQIYQHAHPAGARGRRI